MHFYEANRRTCYSVPQKDISSTFKYVYGLFSEQFDNVIKKKYIAGKC